MRLGHHGHTEPRDPVHGFVRGNAGVFDAVAGVHAGGFDGCQRQEQFGARHAMRRHRPPGIMRPRHFRRQRIEIGQIMVVIVQLHRAAPRPAERRLCIQPRPAHHQQPLRHPRPGVAREIFRLIARRHLGHPGDAQRRQPPAERRQIGRYPPQPRRNQRIAIDQPAIGGHTSTDFGDGAAVEQPHPPAAMLNAHRPVGAMRIEPGAIDAPDTVVKPHPAQPARARRRRQRQRQRVAAGHLGRPAAQRTQRRCGRIEVDMMVVQAGDQGAALRIEAGFPRFGRQVRRDGADDAASDAHIAAPARHLRPLDQHGLRNGYSGAESASAAACHTRTSRARPARAANAIVRRSDTSMSAPRPACPPCPVHACHPASAA